jgi:hypothetical protein
MFKKQYLGSVKGEVTDVEYYIIKYIIYIDHLVLPRIVKSGRPQWSGNVTRRRNTRNT